MSRSLNLLKKLIPLLVILGLLVPEKLLAQSKVTGPINRLVVKREKNKNKAKRKAEAARKRKKASKSGSVILTPPPKASDSGEEASGAKSAESDPSLPGEKEFNDCLKIPGHRRVKITLKKGSELSDLIHWISSMTCKRFILPDTLRAQKVTILSPTPVTASEAYRAFLSALEVMGLTVVPSGRYLKVVQGNWAIQNPIPLFTDKQRRGIPSSDAVVTQMLQVINVDVNELLLVLNKMKSRNGDVTAYKPSNMLIITDNGANIRRMMRIVKELDIESEGEKIWVVRLKHADPDEVNKILTQLFTQKRTNKVPRVPRRGRGSTAPPSDVQDISQVSASKIVSDATTNSLIIVATATAFTKIASLIKKLDVQGESANEKIHVYYLENADAEDVATTLSSLTSGARGRSSARRGRRTARRGKTGSTTATLFEGDVKVSADKPTNSLVIVGTNRDYMSLRRVIRKLDIPRRQVFVEATILEISLDKNRNLGFSYHGAGLAGTGSDDSLVFGGTQSSDLSSLLVNPLGMMGMAAGIRGPEIAGSGTLLGVGTDVPAFGVMFQALQNNSNVNVLSSPHILTTDNEKAEITVGQNLPFQGSMMGGGMGSALGAMGAAAGGQGGQALNLASMLGGVSVQRQDVALKLKLTPHVNDSDMVRLELEQEVSDIISQNFNGLGPATSKRQAKTVVVVRDQQTVVIGGLMSNRVRNSASKIPILGDIPLLGYFFKYSKKTMEKTNLLIVLTPYVIRDQSDLRRILKKKMEERREFIERYTSFKHREIATDIDYRHKRGLIAEICKVATQVAKEESLLNQARKHTEQDVEPVDMPKGMSAPPSSTGLEHDRVLPPARRRVVQPHRLHVRPTAIPKVRVR